MKAIKKNILPALSVCTLVLLSIVPMVFSHCEIPCGIYNDAMRLDMMAEHIATIELSTKQIQELSAQTNKDYNQLVRWIANKEKHADYLSEIATQYFMKQRVKPVEKSEGKDFEEYVYKLTLLHKIMVYSMKCKQTTDLSNVEQLRDCLKKFKTAYLGAGGR